MRVLLYCDDPGYGGTAINACLLAAGLAGEGFTVGFATGANLTVDTPGIFHCLLGYDTQRFFEKTLHSRNEPEAAFLAFRPDAVLFCDGAPDSSLAAKAVCRDWGIAYAVLVNYVAPSHIPALADRREAVAQAYGAALAVVAVSVENLWLLRTWFRVSEATSRVIHYGRPDAFFTAAPAEARECRRQALGVGPDDVLCLTLARFEPRKGYQHLVAAIRLLEGHPAANRLRFAWIGHSINGEAEKMAIQVAACGLSGRIAVLGRRDDVRDWLAAADLFVLPSESEGMPLCVIEAMAQGVPVVATAVSGLPEQVGNTGILVPDPGQDEQATAAALARALVSLALDPGRRQDFGQAARRRARALFRAETMVAAYAALLTALSGAVFQSRPAFPQPHAYRPPHAAPFGQEIPIGDDRAAAEFLRDGWGHGEGEGRWTVGDRASLVMAVDGWGGGYVLALRVRPFLEPPDAAVGLEIRCDGRTLGRFSWTGEAATRDLDLVIFPQADSPAPEIMLELLVSGASSPFSHGQSDDTRVLGVWVSRLRLDRLSRADG